MQTTATAVESAHPIRVPHAQFGTRARRIEQKPRVAAPRRRDESEAWVLGLLGTLAMTNLGVFWVAVNYLHL
jgi:hypothetical protein